MIKQLPYGTSNFGLLITENYYYIDKTSYIAKLEQEPNRYQFFIRPRKFGKSLFISMLDYYYDINKADQFETLFKDTYIGKHPTKDRNTCGIINFDFSRMNTSSPDAFIQSFQHEIQRGVCAFLAEVNVLPQATALRDQVFANNWSIDALGNSMDLARQHKLPLYVIIDEYDHFANDLIALGRDEVYKKMIRANGIVRDFYEALKVGTKTSLKRIFITGISPVMFDDLTSGFNIAGNLTTNRAYNEMMGFTQTELEGIVANCQLDPKVIDLGLIKMYYNGYLFNEEALERIYNPSMLFYYLNNWIAENKAPDTIYDDNLRTDYSRLQNLIAVPENRAQLEEIILNESIIGQIESKFSIDNLGNTSYFISLLFYMGMLTIDGIEGTKLRLRIPNYSIKTLYWGYLERIIKEDNESIKMNTSDYSDGIDSLSKGDAEPFIQYISKSILSKLSNRDLQNFDEKYIKVIILSRLFFSNVYCPISERENEHGYTDIYLQRSLAFPNIPYEWIFELKYIKTKDRKQLPQIREEALAQLDRYAKASPHAGRSDLKTAVILFIGKKEAQVIVNGQL